MPANNWIFRQMSGSDPKTITLEGYAAPFGRPRQKPVVKDKLELRNARVQYPGSDNVTRHVFGTKRAPITLAGRWMDKFLGIGRSAELIRAFEALVADGRLCAISWGSIVSYVGLPTSIEIDRESETEVAWILEIDIDRRADRTTARTEYLQSDSTVGAKIQELLLESKLRDWEKTGIITQPGGGPELKPQLLDTVGDILGTIGTATSQVAKFANQVDDFEKASVNTLQQFRANIHQIKTGYVALTDTMSAIPIDASLFVRQADDDIKFLTFQNKTEYETLVLLQILADLERSTNRIETGLSTTSYTARDGDTWEFMATKYYADAGKSDIIRQANGIRYGERPSAGRTYLVPTQ